MLDLIKESIVKELIKTNQKIDILDQEEFKQGINKLDINELMKLYEPMLHLHCIRCTNKELEKIQAEDFLKNAGVDIEE
ncbi:hypothetical protein OCS97_018395 [Clostridioides difficile]|nr:hypothetical protein [Clostridioides difficile]MDV9712596.1 hypothetical protein [Clostridioides difficile]